MDRTYQNKDFIAAGNALNTAIDFALDIEVFLSAILIAKENPEMEVSDIIFNALREWDLQIQPKPISGDFFIPVKEDPTDYYYRFDFNLKVGDIVKFAEGAFDEYNKMMYNTANSELAVKQGVVTDIDCVISSFLNGSAWTCKVDFNGEIIELLCGFFEKI